MTDLNKLVDDLSALTVLEAAELAKMLEEKWGVSAAAAVAVAAAPAAGAGAAASAEGSPAKAATPNRIQFGPRRAGAAAAGSARSIGGRGASRRNVAGQRPTGSGTTL